MATRVFKPIYRNDQDGELGRLPNGGIINAGGVTGPTFTVGGKGLLFDDGTSTGGGSSVGGFTLQGAYNNSVAPATINLTSGKNFVLSALNSNKFIFDAATGSVTIDGDLTVLGESTVIEGTVSNLDQVNIRPPDNTTVGLTIQPSIGVVPTVNLLEIAAVYGGPLVFSIGPTGVTTVGELNVTGTINGTPAIDLISHLDAAPTPAKHAASQISVDETSLTNVNGSNVQAALESIDSQLNAIGAGNVSGVEFTQNAPAAVWPIVHGKNSTRVQVTVWDETNSAILPDAMTIVDVNTVYIVFTSPQAGRAVLMIF